jgi:hypothetical protein
LWNTKKDKFHNQFIIKNRISIHCLENNGNINQE